MVKIPQSVSEENIAMLVSALTSFHPVNNETSFWNLAKQVTEQIKGKLKTPEVCNVILSSIYDIFIYS